MKQWQRDLLLIFSDHLWEVQNWVLRHQDAQICSWHTFYEIQYKLRNSVRLLQNYQSATICRIKPTGFTLGKHPLSGSISASSAGFIYSMHNDSLLITLYTTPACLFFLVLFQEIIKGRNSWRTGQCWSHF